MTGDKGKRILINLSSASSSSSDDDDDDSDEYTYITSSSSSDDDDFQLIDDDEDFRNSDDDDDDDDDSDENDDDCDDDDDDDDDGDDEHTLSNQVIRFLQEKRDLQELSLNACKSYLRRHGLRVSGNKDVCVERVLEHWRIKDGKAEVLYPRSSFNINCKGDVCRGDIVLFTQKVYGSFDKVKRNGKLLGKRTIAGRVVKESYGAAKQQHTFTVEVLWSKGVKKLPLLFPLLVKGRNLYRLNTYRQPWKNEGERRKVLDEKHRRGTAARLKRDKRTKARSSSKGLKSQKVYHDLGSFQMSCSKGGKDGKEQGVSASKHSTTNSNSQQNTLRQGSRKHTAKSKFSKPCKKPQQTTLRTHHTASRKNPKPSVGFQHGNMHFEPAIVDLQHGYPYHGPILRPIPQHIASYHNSFIIHPPRIVHENYLNHLPSGIGIGQQRFGLLKCSIQGCIDPGSDRCVISACWRCCRREGMRCNVHR